MNNEFPLLQKLGLKTSNFAHISAPLMLEKPDAMLSSLYPQMSALPALRITLQYIDEIAALVDHKNDVMSNGLEALSPEQIEVSWEDMDAKTLVQLRTGLLRQIVSNGEIPEDYKKMIERHFFPLPVSVFAAKDIYIKAGTVFKIEPDGHDPVICDFGTVTLEEGGLIQIEAPAIITIHNFIKKPA